MTISPTPDQERKIQEALRAGWIDSVEQLLDVGLESLERRGLGSSSNGAAAEAVERLASFGRRNRLSLGGLKIKDLINEGRR